MTNDNRFALIASFLALPNSTIEQRWLTEAVHSAKQTACDLMTAREADGAATYGFENDGFVSESSCYDDFEKAREKFKYWLDVEEELYQSIGYEHYFDEHQSEAIERRLRDRGDDKKFDSLIIKTIATNLMHFVSHDGDLRERGKQNLELAQKEVDEYGPENKSNFDDEWFRLQNVVESAEEYLQHLETVLPLCWDSLREFAVLSRPMRYIPENLLQFIQNDERADFIQGYLQHEAQSIDSNTSTPSSSHEDVVDWEDEGFSCWCDVKPREYREDRLGGVRISNFEDDIPL